MKNKDLLPLKSSIKSNYKAHKRALLVPSALLSTFLTISATQSVCADELTTQNSSATMGIEQFRNVKLVPFGVEMDAPAPGGQRRGGGRVHGERQENNNNNRPPMQVRQNGVLAGLADTIQAVAPIAILAGLVSAGGKGGAQPAPAQPALPAQPAPTQAAPPISGALPPGQSAAVPATPAARLQVSSIQAF